MNPLARRTGRGGLPGRAAGTARCVSDLLRLDGADQPRRAAGARPAGRAAAARRRGVRGGRRCGRACRRRSAARRVRGRPPAGIHEHRADRELRLVRRLVRAVRGDRGARAARAARGGARGGGRPAVPHRLRPGGGRARRRRSRRGPHAGARVEAYPTTTIEALHARCDRRPRTPMRSTSATRTSGARTASCPGAIQIPLGDLPDRLASIPRDAPVTVLCRSGRRAAIAASLLDAAGLEVRLVARGRRCPTGRRPGTPTEPRRPTRPR